MERMLLAAAEERKRSIRCVHKRFTPTMQRLSGGTVVMPKCSRVASHSARKTAWKVICHYELERFASCMRGVGAVDY